MCFGTGSYFQGDGYNTAIERAISGLSLQTVTLTHQEEEQGGMTQQNVKSRLFAAARDHLAVNRVEAIADDFRWVGL